MCYWPCMCIWNDGKIVSRLIFLKCWLYEKIWSFILREEMWREELHKALEFSNPHSHVPCSTKHVRAILVCIFLCSPLPDCFVCVKTFKVIVGLLDNHFCFLSGGTLWRVPASFAWLQRGVVTACSGGISQIWASLLQVRVARRTGSLCRGPVPWVGAVVCPCWSWCAERGGLCWQVGGPLRFSGWRGYEQC